MYSGISAAYRATLPNGMSIPEELARREQRLAEITRARAIIEARAKERHAREQAEYDAKMAAREAKIAATGKKLGGKPPALPVEGPGPTDQVNLTDQIYEGWMAAGGGKCRPGDRRPLTQTDEDASQQSPCSPQLRGKARGGGIR